MKTLLIWLCIMAQASSCMAWGVLGLGGGVPAAGGETPNQEIGQLTGTSSAATQGRGIYITVPTGGLTVSHVYAKGNAGGQTRTAVFAIYNSGGTQVGSCSQAFSVPTSGETWYGGALTTPISLSAGDYYVQIHPSGEIYHYYTATGSNNTYIATATACGTFYTATSGNRTVMSVSNYEVTH